MTEERINEILAKFYITQEDDSYAFAFDAVKQSVNEAIQECADAASIKNVVGKNKLIKVVDRQSILNLKVK